MWTVARSFVAAFFAKIVARMFAQIFCTDFLGCPKPLAGNPKFHREDPLKNGCSFFAYSWKLPAYSRVFLLTVDNFSFFYLQLELFAYSAKVRLIRALRDCEQRSLTVSKKTPTVSKTSPLKNSPCCGGLLGRCLGGRRVRWRLWPTCPKTRVSENWGGSGHQ